MELENDIHKCLVSYGFFPMTLILKELEEEENYEMCDVILKCMNTFSSRFKVIGDEVPTQWSQEFEDEYYGYFKNLNSEGELLAKDNIIYYLQDIRKRLNLNNENR
jgi:hypothetical protein